MISIFALLAVALICYGIYKINKGANREGILELVLGILELLGEILVALL